MAEHDAAMDRDIDRRSLRRLALIFVVGFVLIVCAAWLGWALAIRDDAIRSARREPMAPPPPHLLPAPGTDLAAARAAADTRLASYGWVDRTAGIAHVPIDRAMALLVQRQQTPPANTPPGSGTAPQGAR
jgi:hypothetical protein